MTRTIFKKRIFITVTSILIFFFWESSCFLTARYLKKKNPLVFSGAMIDRISDFHISVINKLIQNDADYIIFDSVLGWSIKPNGVTHIYKANSDGIRGDLDYAIERDNTHIRIACLGDSFTHCDDVSNEFSWQTYLEQMDPLYEVINFGVCAYGLDQSFLRYRNLGQQYHPHVVCIGFMTENILRNVNAFRPFYYASDALPLTKPRFIIERGNLKFIENSFQAVEEYNLILENPSDILPKLGRHDYYYNTEKRFRQNSLYFLPSVRLLQRMNHSRNFIFHRNYYNTESEAFLVTTRLFDQFVFDVQKNGSIPIILLFPTRGEIERYWHHHTAKYDPLIAYFEKKGYRYINLLEGFSKEEAKGQEWYFFGSQFHYNPIGNVTVARQIHRYIHENIASFNIRLEVSSRD